MKTSQPLLFLQVAQILRQRLADGTYPSGIPLPGERELAQQLKVGRVTVRSALTRLQEEGLITRLRGQGTMPVMQISHAEHSKLRNGLLENIVSFGLRTRIALESVTEIPADAQLARVLQVEEGARIMRVVRVRKSRNTPLQCTEVYLPPHIAQLIEPHLLDEIPLLTAIERAGHPFAEGEQELIAVTASESIARLLQITPGAPLLRINRVVADAQKRPIQYLIGHYAPDHYHYHMRLSRTGGATQVWITD